jgi:tRNA G18 (ribose-2'-O)-methylase SpoU
MGNEGNGISAEVAQLVTDKLLIPHFSPDGEHVESLNVSVAAGVFIYEAVRQRNNQ